MKPRAWQRMLSRRRLDLLDPSPLDVEIEDIAHGLARVARWNGQTVGDHAFSVAQHALLVEEIATVMQPDLTRRWQLAALLHMSASHFARAFKNATGHPPHLYLTTERLRLAQSMLSEGRLPLVDIAARAGFQTQQHFTEVFHRYAGCTPRAFRLAHNRPTIR